MIKTIKFLRLFLISGIVVLLGLIVFGFFAIPDEISTLNSDSLTINAFYSLDPVEEKRQSLEKGGEKVIDVKVRLLKMIPIKNSKVKIQKRRYVVPSGKIFGLRIYTQGVVVISTDKVDTGNGTFYPAQTAGIQKGDVIISMNSEKVKDHVQVAEIIKNCGGNEINIVFLRENKTFKTNFLPVYSSAQNKYVAGLWIRDSAAGIGTLTFFEKTTGVYGGLGHAVCDVDTGDILPLGEGDVVEAEISSCDKGQSGEAGELCGSFSGGRFGELYANTSSGVFGILETSENGMNEIPVAVRSEVKTGKAQIISTVDKSGPKFYEIEIERVYPDSRDNRSMIIRITDEDLLEKTGGIVQGMSGSPIIQNGKLVGAVTHVFISEPERGYAIFAEKMIETCDEVLNQTFGKVA